MDTEQKPQRKRVLQKGPYLRELQNQEGSSPPRKKARLILPKQQSNNGILGKLAKDSVFNFFNLPQELFRTIVPCFNLIDITSISCTCKAWCRVWSQVETLTVSNEVSVSLAPLLSNMAKCSKLRSFTWLSDGGIEGVCFQQYFVNFSRLSNLQHVSFSGMSGSSLCYVDHALNHLSSSIGMRSVALQNIVFEKGSIALNVIRNFPNLQIFSSDNVHSKAYNEKTGSEQRSANFEVLTDVYTLQELSIRNSDTEGLELIHIGKLTNLKSLTLVDCFMKTKCFKHIHLLSRLDTFMLDDIDTHRKYINISYWPGLMKLTHLMATFQSWENIRWIDKLSQLVKLSLFTAPSSPQDVGPLHWLASTQLTSLAFSHTNEDMEKVIGCLQRFTGLQDLWLGRYHWTERDVSLLCDLTSLQSLTIPDQITDVKLLHLTSLLYLTKLTLLNFGDEAKKHLPCVSFGWFH